MWSAGLHAALVVLAWRAGLLRGATRDERRETLVEVSLAPTFSPPAPKPVRTPSEDPQRRAPFRHPATASRAAARSPAPASPAPSDDASPAAGAGVDAPLDLTGDTLVVASTGNPAGGAGAGAGTGHGRGAAADRSAPSPGAGDRSGGVSLEHHDWACPWPHEADDQQIDEQTVVIQVVVGPDGSVESATVVSDPGHGFGQAAIACALRTRFTPARDRDGQPRRATSPAVLVRFTR